MFLQNQKWVLQGISRKQNHWGSLMIRFESSQSIIFDHFNLCVMFLPGSYNYLRRKSKSWNNFGTFFKAPVSYIRELAIVIYFDCLFLKVGRCWHCISCSQGTTSFAYEAKICVAYWAIAWQAIFRKGESKNWAIKKSRDGRLRSAPMLLLKVSTTHRLWS